ncbi:MAG: hypothetical protein RL385_1769 [Pseudomonadota bacterium]|jgi:hypothetical protein
MVKEAVESATGAASGPSAEDETLGLLTEGYNTLVNVGSPVPESTQTKFQRLVPRRARATASFPTAETQSPRCRSSRTPLQRPRAERQLS